MFCYCCEFVVDKVFPTLVWTLESLRYLIIMTPSVIILNVAILLLECFLFNVLGIFLSNNEAHHPQLLENRITIWEFLVETFSVNNNITKQSGEKFKRMIIFSPENSQIKNSFYFTYEQLKWNG
jgi:hypothetical protein